METMEKYKFSNFEDGERMLAISAYKFITAKEKKSSKLEDFFFYTIPWKDAPTKIFTRANMHTRFKFIYSNF